MSAPYRARGPRTRCGGANKRQDLNLRPPTRRPNGLRNPTPLASNRDKRPPGPRTGCLEGHRRRVVWGSGQERDAQTRARHLVPNLVPESTNVRPSSLPEPRQTWLPDGRQVHERVGPAWTSPRPAAAGDFTIDPKPRFLG